MGKSKHPPLLKKALDKSKAAREGVKRDSAALRKVISACAKASATATDVILGMERCADEMIDAIAEYAEKVVQIEELEEKAGKSPDAETEKKLAKLEKEADALRERSNKAAREMGTLTDKAYADLEAIGAAASAFKGFAKPS